MLCRVGAHPFRCCGDWASAPWTKSTKSATLSKRCAAISKAYRAAKRAQRQTTASSMPSPPSATKAACGLACCHGCHGCPRPFLEVSQAQPNQTGGAAHQHASDLRDSHSPHIVDVNRRRDTAVIPDSE